MRRTHSPQTKESPIQLKPVNVHDESELDQLDNFIRRYHTTPDFALPPRKKLKDPEVLHFWALNAEGEHVGITGYAVITPYLARSERTILDPKFRGQGMGTWVSLGIEEEIKKMGFYKIITNIYETNIAMIAIKLKQGYTIEGYHRDHDGPGYHEYSLGKVIRSE